MRSASSSDAITITGSDFLAGIHEQIDKDSDYHQVHIEAVKLPAANNSSWLRPVGGFALAASFAAIAVIGVQNLQQTNTAQTEIVAAMESKSDTSNRTKSQLSVAAMKAATVVSAADMIPAVTTENAVTVAANMPAKSKEKKSNDIYKPADSRTRALLKQYVDSHMQFASNTTFVPSVRVISYSDF